MKTNTLVCVALLLFACQTEGEREPAKSEGSVLPKAGPKVRGEEISYAAGDSQLRGYIAWDENIVGPRPGVLVVHEWWGHNDYARERARMLAEMGYTAFALDMYGDGKTAKHPKDAQKFMKEALSNMDTAKAKFLAAQKLLQEHATTLPQETAAIGYCFGGAVVLQMARFGLDLRGVASFHGSLGAKVPAKKGEVKAKVLALRGAADPMSPKEQADAFEKEMAAAGIDYKLVSYAGAKHAFTNPGATSLGKKFELPLAYDMEADHQSWQELKGFLAGLFPTPAPAAPAP